MSAGAVATLAMSAFMFGLKRAHVMRRDYPPRRITDSFIRTVAKRPSRSALNLSSTASHLGYGSMAGALYSLMAPRKGCCAPFTKGMLYGMAIYIISFMGWVPALRILPHPSRDQKGRVATMVAAHLLYGGILGSCQARLGKNNTRGRAFRFLRQACCP